MTLTLLKITGQLFCRVSLTLGFSVVSSWWDSNLVSVGISQKRDYILLMACCQVADDFELLSLSIKKTFLKNQIILAVNGTKFVIYPGQESGYKNTLWSKSFSGERPLPWYQIPFLEWKFEFRGWQWYVINTKYLLMGVSGCSSGQKKRILNYHYQTKQ